MRHVGRNGIRNRALGILAAAAALLAVPAAANASTISFDGTTVRYTAATRETNQLAIAVAGSDLFFSDAGAAAITDGDGSGGCSVSANTATCTLTSFVTTDVQLGGRNDTATASGNLAPITALRIDGGAGADTLAGGNGADLLLGGTGADHLDGNQGADSVFAGAGNDTLQWDPGDGSDVLEGQENRDTLRFNGSNINEQIELSANGPRVRMTRDVANVTLDADGIEAVSLASLGGADTTTVDDLTGTDVTDFTDDLAATGGGGDGAADQVIVNGTDGDDAITISGSTATGVDATGLAAAVHIRGQEPTDKLLVHTLHGTDSFNDDALEPGTILFSID